MKQRIQLSESQLKKMIKEAISELDWKTYRNAQEKNRDNEEKYGKEADRLYDAAEDARDKGDNELADRLEKKARAYAYKELRTLDFGFAAGRAFDDKYFSRIGSKVDKGEFDTIPCLTTTDGSYATEDGGYHACHGKINGKQYDDNLLHYGINRNNVWGGTHNIEDGGDDTRYYSHDDLKKFGYDETDINDIEDARREIRNYRNGNYKYDDKKGWTLKETISKTIKETINEIFDKITIQ